LQGFNGSYKFYQPKAEARIANPCQQGAEAPIFLVALDPLAKANGKGYQHKLPAEGLKLRFLWLLLIRWLKPTAKDK